MKISTSYALRDTRITSQISLPIPNERNLQDAIKHVTWVMQREDPRVTVE